MYKIYVASSWRNHYQPNIVVKLRDWGHEVYDFRHPGGANDGFHWSGISAEWETWDVPSYRDALWNPLAESGFQLDMNALHWASIVVLLLPSGRSAHCEAAWHRGQGKPVIVHSPEPCEPELMYKMFNAITTNDLELQDVLRQSIGRLYSMKLTHTLV
jgi:hypothetical protein